MRQVWIVLDFRGSHGSVRGVFPSFAAARASLDEAKDLKEMRLAHESDGWLVWANDKIGRRLEIQRFPVTGDSVLTGQKGAGDGIGENPA